MLGISVSVTSVPAASVVLQMAENSPGLQAEAIARSFLLPDNKKLKRIDLVYSERSGREGIG
jgi:hypothetical protein